MTDIVERLRHRARVGDGWTRPEAADAAAEIEWLRGERDRLAADLAKAHKDAVAWMEKVHQPAAEIARLREALRRALHLHDIEQAERPTPNVPAWVEDARALLTEGGR